MNKDSTNQFYKKETMKKSLFLGIIAAAFAVTSCDKIEEAIDDFQKDQAPTYVESKDGLTATVSFSKNGYASETEAKFAVDKSGASHVISDTICISFIQKNHYALESAAKQIYEELKEDSDEKITITYDDKKTITVDMKTYVNYEKPIAVIALKEILSTYEQAYKQQQ